MEFGTFSARGGSVLWRRTCFEFWILNFIRMVFIIIFLSSLGAIFGSFINACEWRLFHQKSLMERSACPLCHAVIRWHDNVPIVSFFLLERRCRACKKIISWQYPLVEAGVGILFAFVGWWHLGYGGDVTMLLVRDLFVACVLTFLFVYDLKYQEIPDSITLPSLVLLFVGSLYFEWHSLENLLIGLFVGGGFFLVQYIISRGRWIGGGDIRLGLLMGVILGWPGILVALFLAYVVGAGIAIALVLLKKKTMQSQVPFGAFLAPATLVALLWGEGIIRWYVGLIGA